MSCGCNDTSLPLQNCDPCQNCPPTNAVNLPPCPPNSEPCEEIVYADCTVYDGPNLPALGILDGDRLTSILTKLHRVLNGLIVPPVPYASHTVCATGTAPYCLTYLGLGPVYTSTGAATNSGTTITVGSTTGLQVGMTVEVIAGTGSFPTNTLVTAVPTATTFTVSQAPLVALGGAGTRVKATGKVHTIYNVCVPANTCQSICAFVGSPVVLSGTGTITVNQDCSLAGSIGTTSTTTTIAPATTTTTAAPATTTTTAAPGTTTTTTLDCTFSGTLVPVNTTSTTTSTTTAGPVTTSSTTSTTTGLYYYQMTPCNGGAIEPWDYLTHTTAVPYGTFTAGDVAVNPATGIYYKILGNPHGGYNPYNIYINVVNTGSQVCPTYTTTTTTTSTTTTTTTTVPSSTTSTTTTTAAPTTTSTTTSTTTGGSYRPIVLCGLPDPGTYTEYTQFVPFGTFSTGLIVQDPISGLYYQVYGNNPMILQPGDTVINVVSTGSFVCPTTTSTTTTTTTLP